MNTTISAIIFIVIIVLSIAQKIKQNRQADETERRPGQSRPGGMSERARRMIYGEPGVREATPKGARPQPQSRREAVPARQLMEALFGAEVVEAEEEPDWIPLDPAPREELPERPEPPPVPPPLRREVRTPQPAEMRRPAPAEAATVQRERMSVRQRREREARRRQQEEQRLQKQEQLQQQRHRREVSRRRRIAEVRRTQPTERQRGNRLFVDVGELRRAIIFAEIIGPPRAFEDPQPPLL